jgi:hypothetical protein
VASLRDADRQATRLEGMRRALEMTDGVVCKQKNITVRFIDGQREHPAWCASGMITIAVDMIPDLMSVRGMGTLIGLNYHEVAHTLYSPQSVDYFRTLSGMRNPRFDEAYRILEENRVETLMAGRYAAVRKNFLLPVLTFLKKTGSDGDSELFLLTHGRRYIPKQIRSSYRDLFEKEYGKSVAVQCADIIDRYRFIVLTTTDDFLSAGDLINDLAEILQDEDIRNVAPDESKSTGSASAAASASGVTSPKIIKENTDQKKDADKAKQQEEDDGAESAAGSSDSEELSGEAQDEPDSGAGDGGGDSQDGSGEDDGPDESISEDGGGGGKNQPGEARGAPSSGSGPQRSGQPQGRDDRSRDPASASGVGTREDESPKQLAPHELAGEIQQQINELLKDDDVLREVRSLRSAMDDHTAQNSVLAENTARAKKWPVTSAMVRRSEDIYQKLQEMWAQIESGWNFGVSDGSRLDMNRVFSAQSDEDLENVYIDWEPGRQESSGLEVVLVGDESESMSGYGAEVAGTGGKKRYQVASEGIWELRAALDRVGAKSTVLTFQTGCKVLYHRDEETDPGHYHLFSSSGGTYPADAITEARRILAVSEMPYKLLIVYTDGQWSAADSRISQSLDSMDDVAKVCAIIHGNSSSWVFVYKDEFDVVEETNGDLLDIMARAVMHMMERIVR